jgi:hypothetical protein
MLTAEQKAENAAKRYAAKRRKEIQAERDQRQVRKMWFRIRWVKSHTTGHNPHLQVGINYQGTAHYETQDKIFKCSGSGYSKTDTVLALAFNAHLKYLLYQHADNGGKSTVHFKLPEHERDILESLQFAYFTKSGQYEECFYILGGTFKHEENEPTFDTFFLEFPEVTA